MSEDLWIACALAMSLAACGQTSGPSGAPSSGDAGEGSVTNRTASGGRGSAATASSAAGLDAGTQPVPSPDGGVSDAGADAAAERPADSTDAGTLTGASGASFEEACAEVPGYSPFLGACVALCPAGQCCADFGGNVWCVNPDGPFPIEADPADCTPMCAEGEACWQDPAGFFVCKAELFDVQPPND